MTDTLNRTNVEKALLGVFKDYAKFSETEAKDAVFHMMDWLDDLENLYGSFRRAEEISQEELHRTILSFLIHVPEHVSAAAEIVTGFPVEHIFSGDEGSSD